MRIQIYLTKPKRLKFDTTYMMQKRKKRTRSSPETQGCRVLDMAITASIRGSDGIKANNKFCNLGELSQRE